MASVFDRIKRNPVLVTAFLVALGQAVEAGDPVTWEALITVVVGVVVRQFVSPTSEVVDKLANAYEVGRIDGIFGHTINGPSPTP